MRIYDGRTDTHKWAIARHALRFRGVHSTDPRRAGRALGAQWLRRKNRTRRRGSLTLELKRVLLP